MGFGCVLDACCVTLSTLDIPWTYLGPWSPLRSEIESPEALDRIKPRYRFMSAYEQKAPSERLQNA